MHPETLCVHTPHDPAWPGVNQPAFTASAFRYGPEQEVVYPRYSNTPDMKALAAKLARLEHAPAAWLFSSGMAAIANTLLALVRPGEHILFSEDLYGGTLNLITKDLTRLGIQHSLANATDLQQLEDALRPNTRLLYVETPSNPLLKILDLRRLADWAKERGLMTMVDNTFASPINQNPMLLGFDLVVHSGTKYLGGHSDLMFGVVMGSAERVDTIRQTAINLGANLSGLDTYMIDRSLKTLAVRVKVHNQNARALAGFLLRHPRVKQVHYPGFETHPMHEVARSQMADFGGMLAFELKNPEGADRFLAALRHIAPALSLGGVESLISQPARTSHSLLSQAQRDAMGITLGTMRFSVGLEHPDDLMQDLDQALRQAG